MLRTRLSDELKLAVKDKDDYRKATLRLILAALKDRDIAAKSKGCLEGINDDEIIELANNLKEGILKYNLSIQKKISPFLRAILPLRKMQMMLLLIKSFSIILS